MEKEKQRRQTNKIDKQTDKQTDKKANQVK